MVSDDSTHPLRVELVQFRPRKGAVAENLSRIAEQVRAATGRADVLVFPETATSGYFVEGAAPEVTRTAWEVADALGTPGPDAPDVVLGYYEGGDGPVRNAGTWFTPVDGRYAPLHTHRKLFLPTYRLFDEARFVSPGHGIQAFDTRFGRVGILICEEMLHSLPATILALGGARLLVTLAASPGRDLVPGPGRPGSMEMWDVAGKAIAQEHGVYLAVAHLVGSEGGKLFPGGSTLYGPGGRVEVRGPVFSEGVVAAPVDFERARREQGRSPLLADLRTMLPHLIASLDGEGETRDQDVPTPLRARRPRSLLPDPDDRSFLEVDPVLLEETLVFFLREEVTKRRGFRKAVVGVSGGVDSAVTLALAVRAFGQENVHGFLLPYATSSPESLEHGHLVLERFGVEGRTIPISGGVDAYVEQEEPGLSSHRRGNLAARFRALVLWDQAARLDALILGTGNKSERLLGYFTWHADDSPPINPLGDLFKTQVLALARHLEVPDPILDKPASADLVEGVTDEDELGVRYAVADPILHWLLDGFTTEELLSAGFEADDVEVVARRLEGTHWKRRPPTTAVVSSTAIGEFYLRPVDY